MMWKFLVGKTYDKLAEKYTGWETSYISWQETAHEFAFERRDHPWQASVFIWNVATFVDRNRSHRWKMRLKSNSPAQPSGGDEGDGDTEVLRRTAPFELRADDEILIFLADGALAPLRSVFVYLILNHDVATLATLRRLFHRNSFQFRAEGCARKRFSTKSLASFIAFLRTVTFRSFGGTTIPKNFVASERFNKRGNKNFMLKFYDTDMCNKTRGFN